ncbi:hypothetical protein HY417_03455 [Candidatus Kaiserbacteria bacterium]|nr:hypothetical protein [Candidatus Kaiserbacteria bacterium]
MLCGTVFGALTGWYTAPFLLPKSSGGDSTYTRSGVVISHNQEKRVLVVGFQTMQYPTAIGYGDETEWSEARIEKEGDTTRKMKLVVSSPSHVESGASITVRIAEKGERFTARRVSLERTL